MLRNEIDIKLPKQWKHWCKKAGLRRWSNKISKWDRNISAWFYLKGRGYVWRVNCYGEFERGDSIENFDRWALCDIDSVSRVPENELEFLMTVQYLISLMEKNDD